ncbi:MAG: magnesium transporter [Algiphilus sp.]
MEREDVLFSLRAALNGDDSIVPTLVRQTHPADMAAMLAEFEPIQVRRLIAQVAATERAEIFGYLPPEFQLEVVQLMTRPELVALFVEMSSDERADLYNELPQDAQETLLPALAQVEREDIRKLAAYEEGTVGSVMTSEYATLTPELTARQAVEQLRRVAPDKETIYQAYVIDELRRLIGTVSLRDLIIAPPHARVEQFMKHDPIHCRAEEEQREAAHMISKYDLIALPVVDADERLVGIVTYDDAMDVAEEAATTGFHKAGGSSGALGSSIRDASITSLYRSRVFWLVVLVFGNIFSGAGIAHFEETISTHLSLLFFLPLLIASAGNAGSQASTLMVRALATGDVLMRDWGRMLGREFLVASLLGLTMAVAISGIGAWRGGVDIAWVVAMTMIIVVVVGSLIGMSLPFAMSRLKVDPATASAPLVASIADVTGVVIYFTIAAAMLGTPAVS